MDRSATRRGAPAAHVTLTGARPGPAAAPDADWFGTSAAILAGDLAFLWADELLDSAGDGAQVQRARAVFNRLRTEVIAGQYLDLRLAAEPSPSEAAARRVALLKTARYTVSRPLQLGAALGGGSPELDGALEAYGDAVGTAFQLRDDVLGLYGDPAVTGKSRLDDLREGKRTLLVVRALTLGDEHQRSTILRALGDPDLDEEGAARCRDAVAATGALASVEALAADRFDTAVQAIAGLAPHVREPLVGLAAFAADRKA
jgi:geranylgeranyl diphosphate synthase, type I